MSFCRDVLPDLHGEVQVQPTCHGQTAMRRRRSLVLDTSAGVGATALEPHRAGLEHRSALGDSPARGRHFGVDMPIIDPGKPGNSWLMYKVEPRAAAGSSTRRCRPALARTASTSSRSRSCSRRSCRKRTRITDDIERAHPLELRSRSRDAVPRSSPAATGRAAHLRGAREGPHLDQEPRAGRRVPECGGCEIVPDVDAGGPVDASLPETTRRDAGDAGTRARISNSPRSADDAVTSAVLGGVEVLVGHLVEHLRRGDARVERRRRRR